MNYDLGAPFKENTMTFEEFDKLIEENHRRRQTIMAPKGRDYTTGDGDRLSNFKQLAELLGISPMQVWATFFMKHITAILSYVREGKVESEGIEGRFDDAANYLDLGDGLRHDLEQEAALKREQEAAPPSVRVRPFLDYEMALTVDELQRRAWEKVQEAECRARQREIDKLCDPRDRT